MIYTALMTSKMTYYIYIFMYFRIIIDIISEPMNLIFFVYFMPPAVSD